MRHPTPERDIDIFRTQLVTGITKPSTGIKKMQRPASVGGSVNAPVAARFFSPRREYVTVAVSGTVTAPAMIGPMSGDMSIAPMITAVELVLSPSDAMNMATMRIRRTSPTIYDVMIGFFGGAAGILAIGSKIKGNVIPGVAIATALMPPLCTVGYGLATFQ